MKKNKDRKRKVLPLWATLLVAFACIAALVGGTVLVLFLMGRMRPQVVAPGAIEFSTQVDGMAYMGGTRYDEDLASNVQLIYTADETFSITLQTANKDIVATQTAVELELSGANPVQEGDTTLKNSIIEIPRYVNLYRPFEVKVDLEKLKTFTQQDFSQFSAPIITAKSENTETTYIYAQIFVDLSVEDTQDDQYFGLDVTNSNYDASTGVYEVYQNTTFSVEPVFSPAQSGQLFLQPNTQKQVFYNFVTDSVEYDWANFQDHRFSAVKESEENSSWIDVYTFKNSYYQKAILDKFSSLTNHDDLNDAVIDYFNSAEGENAFVKKTINIKVKPVTVDTFYANESKNFAITADKYFTITANSSNGNGTLEIELSATVQQRKVNLKAFLGNVGIKIDKNAAKSVAEGGIGLKIVGGQYMQCTPSGAINLLNSSNLPQNWLTDENDYYVLANSTPADANDYYWKISTTAATAGGATAAAQPQKLFFNLFHRPDGTTWQKFYEVEQEKSFSYTSSQSRIEPKPEWQSGDSISVTMNFDEVDGQTPIPNFVEFPQYFKSISASTGAVYTTVKYFLVDERKTYQDGNGVSKTYADIFGLTNSVKYDGFDSNLFELVGDRLNIYKALSGTVRVVAATVKTTADNTFDRDANGHYRLIQVSEPKIVNIQSNLSINMLAPSFAIENANINVTTTGDETRIYQVYLPVGNLPTKISFSLQINDENIIKEVGTSSSQSSAQRLLANWQDVLEVRSLNQDGQPTDDIYLESLQISGSGNGLIGTLNVSSDAFNPTGTNDTSKSLSLQLWFDDGISSKPKAIVGSAAGTDEIGAAQNVQNVSNFLVYYPQARSLIGQYEKEEGNFFDQTTEQMKTVQVEKTRTQTTVSWADWDFEQFATKEQKIAELNRLLTHKMIDQYGFVIDENNSRYEVRMEEGSGKRVLILDQNGLRDFASTQGQSEDTYLCCYVWDSYEGKPVFENGLENGRRVQGNQINFQVLSEGIDHIEKSSNPLVLEDGADENFVTNQTNNAPNNSVVRVEKYMAPGKNLQLANLVKVYTSTNKADVQEYDENLVFTLSDGFVDGLTTSQRTAIMQMLKFNGQAGVTNIYQLRDTPINSVEALLPFGVNTTIEFTVTDNDNSLFNFTLQLVCRTDTTMTYDFSKYAEKYQGWLNGHNAISGVFGGEEIDLASYITFSASKYPGDVSYNLSKMSINNNGNNVVTAAGGTKIRISDVYQFTQVSFSVYYGVESENEYVLSTTIVLYVNPNIVIVSENQQEKINLFNFENNNSVTEHFNVFKATEYYDYLHNSKAMPQNINSSFVLENVSQQQLLQANNFDNFAIVESAQNISLDVGASVAQEFVLKNKQNSSLAVDAVFVNSGAAGTSQLEHKAATKLQLMLTTGTLKELSAIIFGTSAQEQNLMQVVNYQGKDQLLLSAAKNYTSANDKITFTNVTGSMFANTISSITTSNPSGTLVSTSGNSFVALKTIAVSQDKNISVATNISAIVSQLGSQLVNYTTKFNQNGQDVVNDFSTQSFENLVSGGYDRLQQQQIYQEVTVGTHTVVWNSSNAFNKATNFGFVYDSAVLTDAGQFTLSVVENAEGYVPGLATIAGNGIGQTRVVIGDLANGVQDAFVVLKIEFSVPNKTNFVEYFRMKVSANFSVAGVQYPYAEDAEYLDATSPYFNKQTGAYELDLNENFSSSNSASKTGTRFPSAPTMTGGAQMQNTKFAYKIHSAKNNGADANFADVLDLENSNISTDGFLTAGTPDYKNNSNLKIKLKDNNAKITLVIEKVFYKTVTSTTDQQLFGTEVFYTLRFNQGKTYSISVLQQNSSLYETNGIVQARLVAGSGQTRFTIGIAEVVGSGRTPLKNYHIFLLSGSQTDALQSADLDAIFQLDGSNGTGTLTLSPVENNSLTQDSIVSFGFYTDQKVAFVLQVKIVTAYTIETVEKVGAGKEIAISEIVSVKNGDVTQNVTLENISSGTYQDVSLSSLAKVGAGSVTFAHVAEDLTFTFKATVGAYNFTFDVVAQKDFNLAQTKTFSPSKNYVAGTVETVTVEQVLSSLNISTSQSNSLLESGAFVFETSAYEDISVAGGGASFTHTIPNVGGTTKDNREMRLSYKVNGQTLFTLHFTYMFTILPNVQTQAYYPDPTGTNMLEQEYVGTQSKNVTTDDTLADDATLDSQLKALLAEEHIAGNQRISDGKFAFSEAAEFAYNGQNRVVAQNANQSTQSQSAYDWKIYISYMFNVSIVAQTGGELQFVTTDDYQTATFDQNTKFFFLLTNQSQNGRVEFQVFVNEVPLALPYNVIVVPSSTITVGTNAPNYAAQAEVIYAEDLSRYEEKTLFTTGRILQYQFKSSVPAGTQYSVQFSKSGTHETATRTITAAGSDVVNLDLGESFDGYTFEIYSGSQKVENLSSIFEIAPKLTSRFVVKYYDGSEIASQNFTFSVKRNAGSSEDAADFKLKSEDVDKIVQVSPIVRDKSGKQIANSTVYNINLKTSFTVQGNADNITSTGAEYHTEVLQAGNSYSLLGNLGFGIYNPRAGAAYTTESMATSGGTLLLQMYGFGSLALADSSNTLQKSAYTLHTNLQNQEIPLEGTNLKFKYFTGLNPRAGTTLVKGLVSGGSSSGAENNTNANNYITISGKLQNGTAAEDGTAVDYIINAGGANNNGNHVMMRLTYRVDIGDKNGLIEISHNILFKVLPNSSISFRTSQSNPNHLESADNTKIMDTENNQSIASNVDNPFVVEPNAIQQINLYPQQNSGTTTPSSNPVVVAHMYGNNTDNAAKNFTYTYHQNAETNYNKNVIEEDDISSGSFTPPASNLGIDRYYIDFVNNYGYKARFYFNVLASSNPQISRLTSSTLTEGDTLKVGAQYTLINGSQTGDGYTVYQAFDYVGWENQDEDTKVETPYYFKNQIVISTQNFDGVNMNEAKITFELQKTQTLTVNDEKETKMTVSAGTNLSRIVTLLGGADKTISIFESDKPWKATIGNFEYEFKSGEIGQSNIIDNTMLIRSKIMLSVKLSGQASGKDLGLFSATYKWDESKKPTVGEDKDLQPYTIPLLYSQNLNVSPDIVAEQDKNRVGVELSGIPAYAFGSSFGAVDENAIGDKISEIDSFTITNIAFKVTGQNKLTDALANKGDKSQKLITRSGLKFWNGTNWTAGVQASDVEGFTVPNFDGALYGISNTLNDVVMQVTISNDENSSVMEHPVTIMRQAAADAQLLANNGNVLDGDNPSVNTSVVGTEFSQIYNDTLEVELQPYESVSLVLSTDGNNSGTSVLVENNFGYAVTRYVGISANVNNLQSLNDFKAFYLAVASRTIRGQAMDDVSGATIYYNGNKLTASKTTDQSQTLVAQQLTFNHGLNIENVDELVGRTKQISLHLLATTSTGATSQTGQTYQYVQNVTIHPVYASASSKENVITAQNYYKLSSGATNEGQYLVPLSSWADGLELVPSVNSTPTTITGAGAYKFRYEINSTQEGAGSAIIDENGNIITTKDFDVDFHRVYVNIYMKVSGIDGSFSDENTEILLNSSPLAIALAKKDFNSLAIASSGFVSVENTPVALGSNIKLFRTVNYPTASPQVSEMREGDSIGAFAAQKDTPAILKNWFDDLGDWKTWTNKHYHVLSDTFGGQTTLHNFNNYDQFTFSRVGEHKIEVAVTGRNGSGSAYTRMMFTATVLVQDSSAMHEKLSVVTISKESSSTSGQIALGSGFDWYEAKQNDALTTITGGNYNVSQAGAKGIVAKKFLKVSSTAGATSNATVVDATFYNCTELKDRTGENAVKVSVNQMYSLANLAPASSDPITYMWYKVDGDFDENGGIATAVTAGVVRENLTHYASGASVTCHYVLVIYNSANAVEDCIFYNVTYNIGAN